MTEAPSHTSRTVFLKVHISPCHESQKPHLLRLVPMLVNCLALVDSGCWRGPVYSHRCPLNSPCLGHLGYALYLLQGTNHIQVLMNIHSSHRWGKQADGAGRAPPRDTWPGCAAKPRCGCLQCTYSAAICSGCSLLRGPS